MASSLNPQTDKTSASLFDWQDRQVRSPATILHVYKSNELSNGNKGTYST